MGRVLDLGLGVVLRPLLLVLESILHKTPSLPLGPCRTDVICNLEGKNIRVSRVTEILKMGTKE